jgi:hypothetical protein
VLLPPTLSQQEFLILGLSINEVIIFGALVKVLSVDNNIFWNFIDLMNPSNNHLNSVHGMIRG